MPAQPLIRVRGRGPDLVVVHGWGHHSGCWEGFGERLESRFRVHRVDLPGHGGAPGGEWTLAGVVGWLGERVPAAAWLGWSLGALPALEAASRNHGRVKALVLLSASPCFVARTGWPHGVMPEDFATFRERLQQDPTTTLQRFLERQVAGAKGERALLRRLRASQGAAPAPDLVALLAGLDVLAATDLVADLPGVPLPALWLAGGHDRVIEPAASAAAAALMPAGRYQEIAGASHVAFLSHPEALVEACANFLEPLL